MTPARTGGVVAALACLLVLAGCGDAAPAAPAAAPAPAAQGAPAPAAYQADPATFAALVARPDVTVVNVHVPDEGSIPGTDLAIPFDQVAARAAELPQDRSVPLAIYCRTGPMSTEAASTLAGLGYTNVTELTGGMGAWQASGRPLLPPGA